MQPFRRRWRICEGVNCAWVMLRADDVASAGSFVVAAAVAAAVLDAAVVVAVAAVAFSGALEC